MTPQQSRVSVVLVVAVATVVSVTVFDFRLLEFIG